MSIVSLAKISRWVSGGNVIYKRVDRWTDGLGTRGKSLDWSHEEKFEKAIEFARKGNVEGWSKAGRIPNIPWRMHVAIWAAQIGLRLKGDFVECGVHTGLLSMAICHYLDFAKTDKKFFLFDTFEGIPVKAGLEEQSAAEHNQRIYFDVYELAKRNFAPFPNCVLVKGELPGSFEKADMKAVSYLSIDLNNAEYEMQSIRAIWPIITQGAPILLDDYGHTAYEAQRLAWNDFAKEQGRSILTLPTGQGLMFK